MRLVDFYNFKFNHIRIFLYAAEYKNFSKAAEHLNITQPMVSKAIHSIEEQFGIILFVKKHNRVQLTPAGRELYKQWGSMIGLFEKSIKDASDIQSGLQKKLTIGIGPLADEKLIAEFYGKCLKANPEIDVSIESYPICECLDKLSSNDLDAILTSTYYLSDERGEEFSYIIYKDAAASLFVPRSFPISSKETLTFMDLKSESFIVLAPEYNKRPEFVTKKIEKWGNFTPHVSYYAPNEMSVRAALISGKGVSISDIISDYECDSVKKYVQDNAPNPIILVWKNNNVPEWALSFFNKLSLK